LLRRYAPRNDGFKNRIVQRFAMKALSYVDDHNQDADGIDICYDSYIFRIGKL